MSKFFLQSKTILGILLMALTNLGPLFGISFTEGDAAMVREQIDAIITAVGALIATWGRATANSSIRLF